MPMVPVQHWPGVPRRGIMSVVVRPSPSWPSCLHLLPLATSGDLCRRGCTFDLVVPSCMHCTDLSLVHMRLAPAPLALSTRLAVAPAGILDLDQKEKARSILSTLSTTPPRLLRSDSRPGGQD